jgi:hypothetical protein
MKAYIEASVINRSIDQETDAISFAESLRVLGYEPVLGLNVIYELAKCFLTDEGTRRGGVNCLSLSTISPTFFTGSRDSS